MELDAAFPLDVRRQSLWLKPENRRHWPRGRQIVPVSVLADSSSDGQPAGNLIDNRGLEDFDRDSLKELKAHPAYMWLSQKGNTTGSVELELPGEENIGLIEVWNYNQLQRVKCGVKSADISVWTAAQGWKKILDDYKFMPAQNCDDYDEPVVICLDPVIAKKIRFEDMRNLGDKEHIGLSKIAVYEVCPPKAFNPVPADIAVAGDIVPGFNLEWMPGQGSCGHKVYIGTSPDKLESVGTFEKSWITVSGLTKNIKYYWRVDEVQKDGSAVSGDLWSFELAAKLLGHWKLDEQTGTTAADQMQKRDGKLLGNAQWRPGAGRTDGCLELDGKEACVEIPPLNITTDHITITAWVRVHAPADLSGIVFHRSSSPAPPAFGLNFSAGSELRHHWEPPDGWNRPSGLVVPDDRWTFVAACIEPRNSYLYTYDGMKLSGKTIPFLHPRLLLDKPFYIGKDPGFTDRMFRGMIDDVRIYDYTLNQAEIEQLATTGNITSAGTARAEQIESVILVKPQTPAAAVIENLPDEKPFETPASSLKPLKDAAAPAASTGKSSLSEASPDDKTSPAADKPKTGLTDGSVIIIAVVVLAAGYLIVIAGRK